MSSTRATDPFLELRDPAAGERLARRAGHAGGEAVAEMCRSVARFCRERLASPAGPARSLPELRGELAALGLFGLTSPVGHGGVGLGPGAVAEILGEVARHDLSLATTLGVHNGLGLAALLERGTPEQQARFLPAIARGDALVACALTEPGAGSDLAGVQTQAVARGGGALVLDGEKCFITNGAWARWAAVLAVTPGLGESRWSLLFVDLDAPGVTRGREERKLGLHGSSTVSLRFEGVEVPVDHVLGAPGLGLELVQRSLAWGRLLLAAGAAGAVRTAIDVARRHVQTRRRRDRPLLELPLVAARVARAEAGLEAMETLVRAAAFAVAGETSAASTLWVTSVAKVICSELAWSTCDGMLGLLGGLGYLEEGGLAGRLCDLRVARIFEGPNEALRGQLAGLLVRWSAPLRRLPPLSIRCPDLAALAGPIDREIAALARVVAEQAAARGTALLSAQLDADRLAEAGAWLYAAAALLARRDAEARQAPPDRRTVARAHLFCGGAVERAAACLARVPAGEDSWIGDAL